MCAQIIFLTHYLLLAARRGGLVSLATFLSRLELIFCRDFRLALLEMFYDQVLPEQDGAKFPVEFLRA